MRFGLRGDDRCIAPSGTPGPSLSSVRAQLRALRDASRRAAGANADGRRFVRQAKAPAAPEARDLRRPVRPA